MGPMDVNSQVMQWRPALIKLTLMPRPDVDDGQPTTSTLIFGYPAETVLIFGGLAAVGAWFVFGRG